MRFESQKICVQTSVREQKRSVYSSACWFMTVIPTLGGWVKRIESSRIVWATKWLSVSKEKKKWEKENFSGVMSHLWVGYSYLLYWLHSVSVSVVVLFWNRLLLWRPSWSKTFCVEQDSLIMAGTLWPLPSDRIATMTMFIGFLYVSFSMSEYMNSDMYT